MIFGLATTTAAVGVYYGTHEAVNHFAQMNPTEIVSPSGMTADGMVDRLDTVSKAAAVGSVLFLSFTGISLVSAFEAIQQSRNS